MKKIVIFLLALLLLAVPVLATTNLVQDDSGLLTDTDVQRLEELYSTYPDLAGFTPAVVTTDSFGGLSASEFANAYYDMMAYPQDGILLLVSLTEGQWYILTSGKCHERISNGDAEAIGEELVELLRDGAYYAAFMRFPELAHLAYGESSYSDTGAEDAPAPVRKQYGKTIAICMAVGMAIGLIAVGIMAYGMKSVRAQNTASDYVRPGSMQLLSSRDIFLYSHVSRTAKPKNNSSGGSGGGSRGGAGGRI